MYIFWQEQISYWTKIYCQPCWRILRYMIQWDRVWLDIFLFSVWHTYLAPVTVHYSLITSFSRPPHISYPISPLEKKQKPCYIFRGEILLWNYQNLRLRGSHRLISTWWVSFCLSDNLSGGWILLQYIEGYKISILSDSLPITKKINTRSLTQRLLIKNGELNKSHTDTHSTENIIVSLKTKTAVFIF